MPVIILHQSHLHFYLKYIPQDFSLNKVQLKEAFTLEYALNIDVFKLRAELNAPISDTRQDKFLDCYC